MYVCVGSYELGEGRICGRHFDGDSLFVSNKVREIDMLTCLLFILQLSLTFGERTTSLEFHVSSTEGNFLNVDEEGD